MCMQDLAIDSRINWRSVTGTVDVGGISYIVPLNPNRIALAVWDSNLQVVPVVRLGGRLRGAPVNLTTNRSVPADYTTGMITIRDRPGVFNGDLLVEATLADAVVWEAVMDTTLSAQVQASANEMGP